jgi:hypothetical protein
MLPADLQPEAPERWSALRRDFIAVLGTRRPPQMCCRSVKTDQESAVLLTEN